MPDETSSTIRDWLAEAVAAGASDLHVVTGYRPTLRLHGRLVELAAPLLTDQAARAALIPLCPPRVLARFEANSNADFALQLEIDGELRRFRVNYFVSGQSIGACFRVIAADDPRIRMGRFSRRPGRSAGTLS